MVSGTPNWTAPLVSTVITTYDRPSYLARAVESVHDQTYEPLELVVVDDCSDTPARRVLADLDVDLDRFHDVHCVRHDENQGANAARNTGVRTAAGTFVAFLDDDDRWKPEKVERQVECFEESGDGVGVVYTGAVADREDGREVLTPEPVDGDLTKALLCRNVVGTLSAVMVRADLAEAIQLDDGFPSWADLEWYVNLSTETEFERLPEPLVRYEFDSHGRLSDDVAKKLRAYHRFLDEFDDLAASYGRLFRRKMRAWAAYRVGSTALYGGQYDVARRLLSTAVYRYPFETRFLAYLLAAACGRYSHGLARVANRLRHRT